MVKLRRALGIMVLSSLALAGCRGAAGPVRGFVKGNELARYDFSDPHTFEEGQYGGPLGGVTLEVINGVYRIRLTEGDGELWWGQWGDIYGDVVIDVDVNQITEPNQNAYGVMCRARGQVISPVERAAIDPQVAFLATQVALADLGGEETPEATTEATAEGTAEATGEATTEATVEATAEATGEATVEATAEGTAEATVESTPTPTVSQGDGYLFLIQGAGSYAILRSRGRDPQPLVDWTTSDAIHVGPDKNHLRAVCVGDYLAFYINDQFVADVIDDTYSQGQVGLVAAATNRLGVRVEFDDLVVSEARAK